MKERDFGELLSGQNSQQRYVCVGLDTDPTAVAQLVRNGAVDLHLKAHATAAEMVVAYNAMVVEVTKGVAAAYKPNLAFYRGLGSQSSWAIKKTVSQIHEAAPDAMATADAKYGDIGNTNEHYVNEVFGYLKADAMTIHGYLGKEANRPFLERVHKGIFVLSRTSNPGGGEFQDLTVSEEPLFITVARNVATSWNENGNCGLVVGATYPQEAGQVRDLVGPDIPLLIPGVGAQGGEARDIVPLALRKGEKGLINASRSITFAKPKEGQRLEDAIESAARKLHEEIVSSQAA